MTPGIYPALSYADYAAIDAVRSSDLKGFRRSALHARYAMQHPVESAALVLGQAVHAALLEPYTFERAYARAPKVDRRTNAGKAEWAAFVAANAGRVVVPADDYDEALALVAAARNAPLVRELLCGAEDADYNEVSLVWEDPDTGLRCKARLDRYTFHDGANTVVELKTTADASPAAFARQIANLGYHTSAAWYLRGAHALEMAPGQFVFVALEKGEPHAVATYELGELFRSLGNEECDRALRAYAAAKAADAWPGYPERIVTLEAPGWVTLTPEPDGLQVDE